jgi:hypothetical protein
MTPQRANYLLLFFIFFLLGTLCLAPLQKTREAQATTESVNNLKQMALSLHSCNDVHRRLPPAFDKFAKVNYPVSIHVHLLPFTEQEPLYQTFLKQGKGQELVEAILFHAPADPSQEQPKGVQNFAANLRVFSDKGLLTYWHKDIPSLEKVEPGSAAIPRTFVDGTSNTFVFATKYAICGQGGSHYAADPASPFAAFFGQNYAQVVAHSSNPKATFLRYPHPKKCISTPLMAQSFSRAGIQVALGDASVRTVIFSLSPETWNSALQPNDFKP